MSPLSKALGEAEAALREAVEVEHAARIGGLRATFEQDDLRVVIFGEFSRGKSTLINALLGRIVLPAKAMPTTGHVARIVFGAKEEVRVTLRDGRVERCGLEQLAEFSTLDLDRKAREDVETIEVAVRSPMLRDGLVLIDTPGICDPGAQTERALAAIGQADLVLLVLNATQLLTEHERDLAVEWMGGRLGKPVVPILNFVNLVEPGDRDDVRRRVDRWSRTHLGGELGRPWYEVNALTALRHELGLGPTPTDDFARLRADLSRRDGRDALRERSRRAQLFADVVEARRGNRDVLDRLRSDGDRVERDRADARRQLRRALVRFDVDARLRRDALATVARLALDNRLTALIDVWYQGESKASLEANANRWLQDRHFEAVDAAEKEAEGCLLALAAEGLARPSPMSVKERMVLNARLNVGELAAIEASDGLVRGSALAAGVVGQTLIPIPIVGFVVGAVVGGWLASIFGQGEPDYVAAYSAKAREAWPVAAADVLRTALEQFDSRADHLKGQIAERLRRVDAESDVGQRARERTRRQSAEEALARCEHLLTATSTPLGGRR